MKKIQCILLAALLCVLFLLAACGESKQDIAPAEASASEDADAPDSNYVTDSNYTTDEDYTTDDNCATDGNYTADGNYATDDEYATDGSYAADDEYGTDLSEYFATAENAQTSKTVRVSTVDELLNALESDTRVVLAPGDYDLDTAVGGSYSNAYFHPDGNNTAWDLIVTNLENCAIVGETGNCADVRIFSSTDGNTLEFGDCYKCQLTGVTLSCTGNGGILIVDCCKDFYLGGCEIDGGWLHSVGVYSSTSVTIENTLIRDNKSAALFIYESTPVHIKNCEIYDSGASALFVSSIGTLWMEDTLIHGFHLFSEEPVRLESLFILEDCSDVLFSGCEIRDNTRPAFLTFITESAEYDFYEEKPLRMENCCLHDNSFTQIVIGDGSGIRVYADDTEYLGGEIIAETHAGIMK